MKENWHTISQLSSIMYRNKHQQFIDNHCWFCGKPFGKQIRYSCTKYASLNSRAIWSWSYLWSSRCAPNQVLQKMLFSSNESQTALNKVHYKSSLWTIVEWFHHNDTCAVCDGKRRGRPKKLQHPGGIHQILRPTSAPCLVIVYLIYSFTGCKQNLHWQSDMQIMQIQLNGKGLYTNMRDLVERMKVLLKNHLLQVKPLTQSLVPLPREKRKRQRAVEDDEEDTILQ